MGSSNNLATGQASRSGNRTLKVAASGVLILVPVALGLAVPLYQRTGPSLAGIPFFYWFQMAMAVLTALATGTVYRLLFTDEEDGTAHASHAATADAETSA